MGGATRKLSPEAWEPYKQRIVELWATPNNSLKDVIKTVQKETGFVASEAQYRRQLSDIWQVRKNWSSQELDYIESVWKDRDAVGKETRVKRLGVRIPRDALRRKKARRFVSTLDARRKDIMDTNDDLPIQDGEKFDFEIGTPTTIAPTPKSRDERTREPSGGDTPEAGGPPSASDCYSFGGEATLGLDEDPSNSGVMGLDTGVTPTSRSQNECTLESSSIQITQSSGPPSPISSCPLDKETIMAVEENLDVLSAMDRDPLLTLSQRLTLSLKALLEPSDVKTAEAAAWFLVSGNQGMAEVLSAFRLYRRYSLDIRT
ncbi:hypothetical protein ABW19_dt0210346 [Dactylella cylindrospora]|nr:hypothetical protein ABW19_dt0210346 [Dactylella cylindrospora]